MISVTVAAHGRRKRLVGTHLSAYGSGRLSLCDLDKEPVPTKDILKNRGYWHSLISKVVEIILTTLKYCCPFLFKFASAKNPHASRVSSKGKAKSACVPYSPIQNFDRELLVRIWKHLDVKSLGCCERTCQKWKRAIDDSLPELPKMQLDQIRLLFDEGEVIIYPVDEKRCPVRYPMPSLQVLIRRLRHITTQSLFVRGLIPIESVPVLRELRKLTLQPQQIYFIWSKFCPDSILLLEEFISLNRRSLCDLGLEECSPPNIITDKIIEGVIPGLSSLRIWNDGKCGIHAIGDATIFRIASAMANGSAVESVDLASCRTTHHSVACLILTWLEHGSSDITISLNHCVQVKRGELLATLANNGVDFHEPWKLRRGNYSLSLFC